MATKINRSLANLAREIKNSDEFVDHIANLARRYRRESALEAGERQRELKLQVRQFHKHASALVEFFQAAYKRTANNPHADALGRLGELMHGSAEQAVAASQPAANWLQQAVAAAEDVLKPRSRGESHSRAHVVAAEGLRAIFEFHSLKFATGSTKKPSDAVRMLIAITQNSGEDSASVETARTVIADVKAGNAGSAVAA